MHHTLLVLLYASLLVFDNDVPEIKFWIHQNDCQLFGGLKGSLFLKPIGIDIAGNPAKFVLTVNTSDKYIAIGLFVFT